MRIGVPRLSFRRLPPTPLPAPTLADIAQALRTVQDNQAEILTDLARIKATLPFVALASLETAMDLAPNAAVSNRVFADALSVINQVSRALA